MPTHNFRIGPHSLSVDDRSGVWSQGLPPNYTPFAVGKVSADAGVMHVTEAEPWPVPDEPALSEVYNDLGVTHLYRHNDGWLVSIAPRIADHPRLMLLQPDFNSAELRVSASDPAASFVLDSMLRIFFSQYSAMRSSMLVHASAVELNGLAYLFMGRSGTGKSTHTRLWLSSFAEAKLINDDVPLVVDRPDGQPMVCGTPWSGKGRIWRNVQYPLKGIARLQQAPVNEFTPVADVDAFIALLPGISVMTADTGLYSRACSTALSVLSHPGVSTGILRCLPNAEAARLARERLSLTAPSK